MEINKDKNKYIEELETIYLYLHSEDFDPESFYENQVVEMSSTRDKNNKMIEAYLYLDSKYDSGICIDIFKKELQLYYPEEDLSDTDPEIDHKLILSQEVVDNMINIIINETKWK